MRKYGSHALPLPQGERNINTDHCLMCKGSEAGQAWAGVENWLAQGAWRPQVWGVVGRDEKCGQKSRHRPSHLRKLDGYGEPLPWGATEERVSLRELPGQTYIIHLQGNWQRRELWLVEDTDNCPELVYFLPVAAVTDYHTLGTFKQQFCRPELQNQGVHRAMFSLEVLGENPSLVPDSGGIRCCLVGVVSHQLLVGVASYQPLPVLHMALSPCVCTLPRLSLVKDTWHWTWSPS